MIFEIVLRLHRQEGVVTIDLMRVPGVMIWSQTRVFLPTLDAPVLQRRRLLSAARRAGLARLLQGFGPDEIAIDDLEQIHFEVIDPPPSEHSDIP